VKETSDIEFQVRSGKGKRFQILKRIQILNYYQL